MDISPSVRRFVDEADAVLDELAALPPRAERARAMRALRRAALRGSLRLAGETWEPTALDALLDDGVVLGARRLDAALAARDLALAESWVAEQRPRLGDPRPLLTVAELRTLHRLAAGGDGAGGIWRTATLPARAGVVSPPPWLVPFETATLVERVRRAPARGRAVWLAAFLARAARVRPFARGNGRVARLAASLLLRRLGLPPLVVGTDDPAAYHDALAAATAGRPDPLAALVAGALRDAALRLVAAGDVGAAPLRALAGNAYPTLAKAAARGRLRVWRDDGGRLMTTPAWIETYRAARWRR